MKPSEISQNIGVSIILKQHGNFQKTNEEDLTHIRNLSVTISGISTYLKSVNTRNKEVSNVTDFLKDYAETLFVEHCVSQRDLEFSEEETEEEFIEETEEYFAYIFKNGKYPL